MQLLSDLFKPILTLAAVLDFSEGKLTVMGIPPDVPSAKRMRNATLNQN